MAKNKRIKLTATIFPALLIALGVLYIFQIVQLTEAGHTIGQKQESIDGLKKETASMELTLSENRNLNNFEDRIKEKGYNEVIKIDYLTIPSNALASK
ncbi:MAG: hypothetical protein PHG23_02230 [Candidatus Pacebacteria bacterium]|nr:hypothetical protein [Candidatus Paceibacterota bacterium]